MKAFYLFLRLVPIWAGLGLAACARDEAGPHVEALLVSESQSIRPGRPLSVGLVLRMKRGWHTYWKNPGDSGMATTVRWKLPRGFSAGPLEWPYPSRYPGRSLMSYGYGGEVLLPTSLRPPASLKPGSTAKIGASAEWLECRKTCVAGQAEFSLRLPVLAAEPVPDPAWAERFAQARSRLPRPLGTGEFAGWTARALRDEGSVRLDLGLPAVGSPPRRLHFFPLGDGLIENAASQRLSAAAHGRVLEMRRSRAPLEAQARRLEGVLVVEELQRAAALSLPLMDSAGQ